MEIKAALMYIKISRNIMLIEYNQTSAMRFLTLRYEFSLLMSKLIWVRVERAKETVIVKQYFLN